MELASQDHLLFKDNLVPRSQSSVQECRKRHFSLRGGGGGWGGGVGGLSYKSYGGDRHSF